MKLKIEDIEAVDNTPEKTDKNDKAAVQKPHVIKNLQLLFASLIKSSKKYQDASGVLRELRDEFGNLIPIGEQKDISEFHLNFIECLIKEIKPQEEKKKEEAKEELKEQQPDEPELNKNESALETKDNAEKPDDMNVDSSKPQSKKFKYLCFLFG